MLTDTGKLFAGTAKADWTLPDHPPYYSTWEAAYRCAQTDEGAK